MCRDKNEIEFSERWWSGVFSANCGGVPEVGWFLCLWQPGRLVRSPVCKSLLWISRWYSYWLVLSSLIFAMHTKQLCRVFRNPAWRHFSKIVVKLNRRWWHIKSFMKQKNTVPITRWMKFGRCSHGKLSTGTLFPTVPTEINPWFCVYFNFHLSLVLFYCDATCNV